MSLVVMNFNIDFHVGLTQMNPNTEYELPLYALPDLVSMGPCWLYAITKRHNSLYDRSDRFNNQILGAEEVLDQDQIVPGPSLNPRRRRHRPMREEAGEVEVHEDSDDGADLPIVVMENIPFPELGEEAVEGGEGGAEEVNSRQNLQENSQNLSRKRNQVLVRK